jgi:hypothetical protein
MRRELGDSIEIPRRESGWAQFGTKGRGNGKGGEALQRISRENDDMYHIQNQQDCPVQGRERGTDGVYQAGRETTREQLDPTREAMMRFDAYDARHEPRYSGGLHHLY